MSARILFSVCCARMSSAWTSGSPALIMVANCRVITTMSRVLTPPPSLKLSLNSRGAARTCTTTMRFLRRWAMTSSRLGRSILSLTRSPFSVRAVYWKTGIAHSLRGRRLAAGRYLGRTRRRLGLPGGGLSLVLRRLADHAQELVGVRGDAQALVFGDFAAQVERVEGVVQRLHTVFLPGLHRRLDLVHLVVADQRSDRRGADHDFGRHHPPPPLRLLQQGLGDHALEHERELGPDLRLLVRREDVDDPVDALHRRVGVQGGEGEVAGLSDGERCRDRLEIDRKSVV